jgi:hypothetical protein
MTDIPCLWLLLETTSLMCTRRVRVAAVPDSKPPVMIPSPPLWSI